MSGTAHTSEPGRQEIEMTVCTTAASVRIMPPQQASPVAHAPTGGTPLASLWRTRGYLQPYLWQLAFMLAAAIVAVGTEITIPLLTKSVIDGAIAHHRRGLLIPLGAAAIALGVTQALLNLLRRWVQASAVAGMERSMRADLYAHLQRLHAGFHDEWQSGQLLSRATTDLSAIRRFAGFGTVFLITNVVTFAVVVGLLIHLNWWLGLLTGGVLLPVVVVSTRFERRYRVLSRLAQDQQGDLATYVEEATTGIRVLKALGRRDEAAARHREQADRVLATQISKARLRGTFWAGLDLIPNILIGLILLLGALATSRHELTLGGLVAFITLALQLVWPIEATGYILSSGQEAATAAQRIYEIFDTEPAITGPAITGPAITGPAITGPAITGPAITGPAITGPAITGPAITGPARPPHRPGPSRLVFDRVGFCYPGAQRAVLRSVSLDVAPGQTVVLVGATGSGKTTLLQLVPRLADVTSGAILLDGTDIRRLPLPELRSRVSCAFEEPTLFSASVRENVGFGAPEADDDAIEAALAAAQADFVRDLPWGLDTRIGEQGMTLSGGQRQRVALARAILARPPVLILDDPLSALDVHTEAKVTRALRTVLAGTTALVVAHRPSTVSLADRVALLEEGEITAQGTHQYLLRSEPRYRELMSGDGRPPAGPQSSQTRAPQTRAPQTRAPQTRTPETRAPETRAPETRAPDAQAAS
jgi:ATP-binding cassette, subfamily B, bacterial